jgi:hypothetical protein
LMSFDAAEKIKKNISVNETPEVGERGETPWYKIM